MKRGTSFGPCHSPQIHLDRGPVSTGPPGSCVLASWQASVLGPIPWRWLRLAGGFDPTRLRKRSPLPAIDAGRGLGSHRGDVAQAVPAKHLNAGTQVSPRPEGGGSCNDLVSSVCQQH